MKMTTKFAGCFGAFLLIVGIHSATGQIIVTNSPFTPSSWNLGGPYVIGNQFTVGSSNITLNALGVFDRTAAEGGIDGFSSNIMVGLWTDGGTLIASNTVLSTAANATLIGNYQFVSVPEFTLLAGATYRIGAVVGTGYEYYAEGFPNNIFSGVGVTLNTPRYSAFSGTLVMPATDGTSAAGRWGAASATFIAIPEPSTFALVGLALMPLMLRRRR